MGLNNTFPRHPDGSRRESATEPPYGGFINTNDLYINERGCTTVYRIAEHVPLVSDISKSWAWETTSEGMEGMKSRIAGWVGLGKPTTD